ncbi:hypothetical protein ONS95_014906 [Cadophora gregata]|uniref:uncharacterized protein n=1 Tax=Cadophora gregata TaxID=51156 RepID=UPI0026DC9B43|nr:uncharacterized protein ONS95_014906 [Cadophora gregata]KAK0113211.1 hypothetical protein ONS95_014906 [Cadophora gregata]KAK0125253.1 hypothetical protein ONS96_009108 [Cadophora gregata f. sp. sojae]
MWVYATSKCSLMWVIRVLEMDSSFSEDSLLTSEQIFIPSPQRGLQRGLLPLDPVPSSSSLAISDFPAPNSSLEAMAAEYTDTTVWTTVNKVNGMDRKQDSEAKKAVSELFLFLYIMTKNRLASGLIQKWLMVSLAFDCMTM